jgi:phytol kinase
MGAGGDVDVDGVTMKEEQNDIEGGRRNCCRCGFPPDPPEDVTTPWEKEEKWCFIIPAVLGAVAIVSSIVHALAPGDLPWMAPPPLAGYAGGILLAALGKDVVLGFFGACVVHLGLPVAITRKVFHVIGYLLVPIAIVDGSALLKNPDKSLVEQVGVLPRTAFAALDRSEDRPNSLLWIMSQSLALTFVEMPMMHWTVANDIGLLRFVCPLAIGLGDGLAEPIGKRFGKHKYSVYALFTKQRFTRSYEGSANVFFWTLVGVLIAVPQLNIAQILFSAVLLPPAMTFAEAKSPHSWDNFFMFGTGWIFLLIVREIKIG